MTNLHNARLARLREAFGQRGLDGALISQPESRFYLSGYTGHDLPPRDSAGYLLITATEAILLTDPRTAEQAAMEAPAYQVETYPTGARGPATVAATATKLGLRRLAFESIHLPFAVWRDVKSEMTCELVGLDGLVDALREVKDASEIEALQAAVDVLDRCFAHVAAWIEPGLTERRIAREVDAYLLEHADGPSFPSIVASGPNGSMPHAVPSERPVQAGEGITLDIGARLNGYCSDMTRTLCLGEPRDSRLAEVHALVLEAQTHAEAACRSGMTGREVDALARDVIAAAGCAEEFTHGTGHGIGLEVHEPPWVSATRGDATLVDGMVFSIEPGIYRPGWGGVRIEDLVVLRDGRARILSQSPKSLVRV